MPIASLCHTTHGFQVSTLQPPPKVSDTVAYRASTAASGSAMRQNFGKASPIESNALVGIGAEGKISQSEQAQNKASGGHSKEPLVIGSVNFIDPIRVCEQSTRRGCQSILRSGIKLFLVFICSRMIAAACPRPAHADHPQSGPLSHT